ncbi:unnamed protein product [Phytophthora fragariaefolia]|uniref:Unnamed protein product n=1 Tax=Phytophthora fragariaefolia TaxID=1490495 RepID=A0A9W6Y6V2_9STRA|nr:unnamed protein product [Phytophthora fragariaefolia]
MDGQSRAVLLAWLIDMITEPAQESASALKVLHRLEGVEEVVVSELVIPKYRDVIAKKRSSHWSMMLFSSQVFYDASMKDLFRLDFRMMACL